MADVFISYKSERRRAAEHLAETIQEHGYSVWWDYGLAAGRDFGVQIEKELREASCVLVLWCEKSVASEWVREEAALAKKLDKLVPSMIERVDLPLGFSLSQTIDLSAWSGSPKARELDRIFREIARLSGKPVTVNYDGLERIEKSWVRFGSPSLREFALQNAVEPRSRPRLQGVPNNRGRWLVPAAAGLGLALLVGAGAMYLPGILRPQTEAEEKGDISNEQPSRAAYLPGGSGHVILSGLRGDTAELELLLTSAFSGQLVNDPRLVVLSSDPRIMEERLLAQRAAGLDPARGDPWEGITNPDFRIDLMLSATTDAAGVPTIEARALVRDLDGRLMSSHVTRLVGVGFETEERSRNAVEQAGTALAQRVMLDMFPAQVARVDGDTVVVTRGRDVGFQVGDLLTVQRSGERRVDPRTGAVVNSGVNIWVADLTIVDVQESIATATITARSDTPAVGDRAEKR